MMRAVNASRITAGVVRQAVAYRFSVNGFAPLDPRKHNTMNHHVHNMYLDLYEYGKYPEWVHICSVAPRTYESQVLNIVSKTLNERFGISVTPDLLNSKRNREWSKFLAKDLKVTQPFHEIYPSLLGKLAFGIFVKESKLTWITEQNVRFDYTLNSFDSQAPATVGQFIDRYNQDIEACVLASSFGFAPEIEQAPSALEKHEMEQRTLQEPGVTELKNLSQEHNNFFNRLLAYLH